MVYIPVLVYRKNRTITLDGVELYVPRNFLFTTGARMRRTPCTLHKLIQWFAPKHTPAHIGGTRTIHFMDR